ncbi:hypothetical protein N657DRAFT_685330 [Parathielavia appendiculata]|uniref:Uncharacterized protein n=1 Tax=Parathielavia appendiculata TaxID=2587402 RepID=A0AAN6TPI4_9PEZI|nr:hypothetical protein N657DRAFT_685330 [Parathielavia appendiculata]
MLNDDVNNKLLIGQQLENSVRAIFDRKEDGPDQGEKEDDEDGGGGGGIDCDTDGDREKEGQDLSGETQNRKVDGHVSGVFVKTQGQTA